MKPFIAAALLIMVCGCLSQVSEPPKEAEQHFVSTKPILAQCNNRTTVDEREECYESVASSATSANLCEEIGTRRIRNLCYHEIAVALLDPAMCINIKDDDWRYTDCMTSTTR